LPQSCGGIHGVRPPERRIRPSQNFGNSAGLPEPACHIFYERRVADVDDSIPKISGYWSSEAYVTRKILGALFQPKADA
jgi:hypothetical protein